MDYDFSQLNDKELESLVVDLLSALLGGRIERFKSGKDGGVDGRFFIDYQQEIILQTKHYFVSGIAKLLKVLEREEKSKVDRLKPARYLLATSCKLSRSDKAKISAIFKPHIISDSDIFGSEDLNDLLRRFPDVEKSHTKLWMSSTALLRRFLNNGLIGRSEDFLRQVVEQRKFYAHTQNFFDAQEKLEKSHILIVSGEPGVGKTTIAENLALLYSAKKFEVIDVLNILEAETAYHHGVRQFFVFDDFLGGNYLEAIGGREDSLIVKFMRRISADDTKRFVLTSRTNILNLGVNSSDPFGNANIRRNEYLLQVGNLSNFEKAEIFYNHLWHSGLPEEYIAEIYKNNRYLEIIQHRNYSPRLIQFVTDANTADFPRAIDYWDFIIEKFERPAVIWRNALRIQSNDFIRSIINLVVFNGGSISERDLKAAFHSYNLAQGVETTERIYFESVSVASKSFIVRTATSSHDFHIKLFNPSLADYVLSDSTGDVRLLARIFDALPTWKSLTQLISLQKNELLGGSDLLQIVEHLNRSSATCGKSIDYHIQLVDLQAGIDLKVRQMQSIINAISSGWKEVYFKERIFDWLTAHIELWPGQDLSILNNIIYDTLDYEETKALGLLLESREAFDENPDLVDILKESMSSLLEESATEWVQDLDMDRYVSTSYYDYGERDIEIDRSGLESAMLDFGSDYFPDFAEDAVALALDQLHSFVSEFDFDKAAEKWVESRNSDWEYDGGWSGGGGGGSEVSRIHDLFNRG